jgi:hypothetical protein
VYLVIELHSFWDGGSRCEQRICTRVGCAKCSRGAAAAALSRRRLRGSCLCLFRVHHFSNPQSPLHPSKALNHSHFDWFLDSKSCIIYAVVEPILLKLQLLGRPADAGGATASPAASEDEPDIVCNVDIVLF